ncbi:hypothetical protein [Bythopirellula polymerisocia]|uniref:Uncharacterized protein n=1 Tax=Bythopirellula polymerisocia TaxID=2528003 RepID=A0A5C6CXK3_9BACT|nr:hypothetical protein [Bythopirellula polymerisocia]TWU27369.1 hypothetical protein Pla144_21410 [Bythopirellula polymerisocia]
MQVRLLTASLALVVGCGALGCKSAPKMAWWSSSKGDKVESTAIAHAAPQLPSEIAKQTEAINTANPVQISTAPAFAANTSTVNSNVTESAMASTPVGAYPSTGAQSYVPRTSAAATTTASTNAMPYNPNAVPAAKKSSDAQSLATNATLNTVNSAADRYGNVATNTTQPSSASAPASGTSYPNFSSPVSTGATTPAVSSPSGLGDRYSQASTSRPTPSSNSEQKEVQQVQTASAIAAADPYRPGGTATYPSTATSNAKYEVATRPAEPASSQAKVPNVAYPGTGTNQYR